MSKNISIYNTLTKKKEPLKAQQANKIGIYACGVTTYDDCHIGHGMQAIFFDVIRRYLEFCGYKVTYVRNYTDVDDKIIQRANTIGISPKELANNMIRSTDEDLHSIGVRDATFQPRVSECIPEIITMIEHLIKLEAAYKTSDGDVYYRVRKKADYGKLSRRNVDELLSGTRDVEQGEKENPLDFALWKQDDTKEASWPSPFGQGRPGWHIECSVMAKKYLGDSFEIHGGGLDLIFPHHENEIAQSESANCCDYASIWMHSGLLTIDKQKMSKSLGNSIRIKDFLNDWNFEVLRFSCLQNHYSSNINFSTSVFTHAQKRLFYFYQTLEYLKKLASFSEEKLSLVSSEVKDPLVLKLFEDFKASMNDDFNTVKVFAALGVFIRQCNQKTFEPKNALFAKEALLVLKQISEVCGILDQEPNAFIEELKQKILHEINLKQSDIEELLLQRKLARESKNWKAGDDIRDELLRKGITIQDRGDETSWSVAQD